MWFLCCVFKDNTGYTYRYFNTDTREYKETSSLDDCANIVNGKCLGFTVLDVLVSRKGGKFEYLIIEEYRTNLGKLTHYGVVDLQSFSVYVLPVSDMIKNCKLIFRSAVCNYNYINDKFLQKKDNTFVESKSTEEYLSEGIYRQDTFDTMHVDVLRELLKRHGMKLGGVSTSVGEDKFGNVEELADEFWYRQSSVLRLTYHVGGDDLINHFSGDMYLLTKKFSDISELDAGGGLSNYYNVGNAYCLNKDIRCTLFRFYATYKDDLLPAFDVHVASDNHKSLDIYLLVNTVTHHQYSLCDSFNRNKDITFYYLFKLLAFKNNIKYFTDDFNSVLMPCISMIDELINIEYERLLKDVGTTEYKIKDGVDWCLEELRKLNSSWKVLR